MNGVISLAPKPQHVPEEAVFHFDMYLDEKLLRDPHDRLFELLREAPKVFWTPFNGGHWIVTGYDEIYRAARDTETFSSQLVPYAAVEQMAESLPDGPTRFPRQRPIDLDPPEHGVFRAPIQRFFSPKSILARRDEIRQVLDPLIDGVIEKGHCDFIKEIGEPLPVIIFLRMMGLPVSRMAEFRYLVNHFLSPTTGPIETFKRMRQIADAMRDSILARRDRREDDLISLLWDAEVDGAPMTLELMEDYAVLLFIGGLDTVINGMGYGIRHLAGNPGLQDELRCNPKRIVLATEELLRRYSFSTVGRRVAADTVLAGFPLHVDDQVQLYLPAGNLDCRTFPSPERFDMDRENNAHIVFNVGPHRCIGSHLARMELHILYEQILTRLPTFRLDPHQSVQFRGGFIIAIETLPIRWD